MIYASIEPELDPTGRDVTFTARVCLVDGNHVIIGEVVATCDNIEQAEGAIPALTEQLLGEAGPNNAARDMAAILAVLDSRALTMEELARITGQRVERVERTVNALICAGIAQVWDGRVTATYAASDALRIHALIALTTIAALAALVAVDLWWLP